MIMYLNRVECLKATKTGKDASMATIIGALYFGVLMASTELPKHRSRS